MSVAYSLRRTRILETRTPKSEKVSNFVEEIKISNWLINQSINQLIIVPINFYIRQIFFFFFFFFFYFGSTSLVFLFPPPSYLFIFIKVLILHVIYQLTITRLSYFVSLFYNWNHPIQIRWLLLLLLLLLLFSIILQLRI